jgi:DNA-binding LytR/AlgR family response regulator
MTRILRVAVAEDEPMNLKRLLRLLREADCEVVATFTNGTAILQWLAQGPEVDALFLDIRMPGASGLEILNSLPVPLPVVFVTAFTDHAVQAFEDDAVDYLLKPITEQRLGKCLDRLRKRRVEPTPRSVSPPAAVQLRRYPVKAGEGLVFLDLSRTTHFEVLDEVVYAHAGGRFETNWKALSDVESAFPKAGLLRIHRHLLIRPEAVIGVKPAWGGRLLVTLPGGIEVESSRGATPRLKERLGIS